jgi:transmembrane sensor
MSRRNDISTADRIDAAAAAWVARRDAGLSRSQQAEFLAWQAADARHIDALARFTNAWLALGKPRRTGASSVMSTVLRTLDRRRRFRRITLTAGAMVVAVFAGFAWWPLTTPTTETAPGRRQAAVLLPQRQTLPDGSTIEHPAGTEFAVDFSPGVRRVALRRGEAHFEIAKDASRPFVVAAAGVEVRAIGTAFAVQLRPEAVEVLVTAGRVEVSADSLPLSSSGPMAGDDSRVGADGVRASARSDAIPIASGSRIVMDRSAAAAVVALPPVLAISPAEIAARLAWRSPRVEFSGAPLAEVVALLNRHNQVQLIIEDPAIAKVALSGLFRADDIDAFVRILETGFNVKAERRGQTISLRRSR